MPLVLLVALAPDKRELVVLVYLIQRIYFPGTKHVPIGVYLSRAFRPTHFLHARGPLVRSE